MIQVNELRINNVIEYFGDFYRVTTINYRQADGTYETFFVRLRGGETHSSKVEEIIPIPLTEDILLKCGFEWNDLARCYQDDHMIELVNEEGINPNYFIWHNNGMVGRNPMCYLHQLQNIYFSLVGKELEVNL